MEHSYIEDHLVVDRYLLNQLTAAERTVFEQHYLSCPHCLDELEFSEKVIRGVKRTSADQVAKILRSAEDSWLAAARPSRWHSTAIWAMAALFLFALPSGLVYRGLDRLEARLQTAHSEWRAAADPIQSSGEDVQAEIEAVRRELTAYRQEAHQRLEEEHQKLAALEAEAAVALRPQANTLILPLSRLRSTSEEPNYRLTLPEKPEWWVLELPLGGLEFKRYRAVLRTQSGGEVWQGERLAPDLSGRLSISVHSSWLDLGTYIVELQGLAQDGQRIAAGTFSFAVQSGESP